VSVSLSEILAGASVHAVPLAGECAGYLVLAAADQAVSAPRRIGPNEVHLEGDGTVRVEGARAAGEAESERDLRALLDALLVNASSTTPALVRASRRAPGRGIAAFVREIETALIPVNRSAAHRALARLERETERARQKGRLTSAPPVMPSSDNAAEPAGVAPLAAAVPLASVAPAVEPPLVTAPTVAPSVEPLLAATPHEIPSLFAPPVAPIAPTAVPFASDVDAGEFVEPMTPITPSVPLEPSVPIEASAPIESVALIESSAFIESVAPPVEAIAERAAEVETRPETVVARRSAKPPPLPRTPSPPMPLVEAQRSTPFFGTVLGGSDDELEIDVVVEDHELLEETRDT
jgi:hypothetical protein